MQLSPNNTKELKNPEFASLMNNPAFSDAIWIRYCEEWQVALEVLNSEFYDYNETIRRKRNISKSLARDKWNRQVP